eukprot:2698080-Pyramimonas_sp.AAC.1
MASSSSSGNGDTRAPSTPVRQLFRGPLQQYIHSLVPERKQKALRIQPTAGDGRAFRRRSCSFGGCTSTTSVRYSGRGYQDAAR